MSTRRHAARTRGGLATVYLAVFLDIFGFGILLPALPYYAEKLGASGASLGVLFAAYSLAQLAGASVLGRLSDRYGRRPILLAARAGAAASATLCGFAHTLVTLAGARALAGLFGGSIATAQAFVADVTRPEERAQYMGFLGAAIGLGFVLGPAVGALLSPFGFGAAAFFSAGLAVVNFTIGLFALRESRPESGGAATRAFRLSVLLDALRRVPLRHYLVATFLVTFAFVGMETTLAFLAEERFDVHQRGFGLMMVYIGAVVIVVQGGIVGRAARRFGEAPVAIAASLLMGTTLALVPVAPRLAALVAVMGGLATSQALAGPTLSALLSRAAGAAAPGGVLGLGQSLAAGGRASGPLLAGWLWDHGRALPFLAGALLAFAAAMAVASARGPIDAPAGEPAPY